ncbi:MAG: hypothetical protein ACK559_22860, partial [bacterium]
MRRSPRGAATARGPARRREVARVRSGRAAGSATLGLGGFLGEVVDAIGPQVHRHQRRDVHPRRVTQARRTHGREVVGRQVAIGLAHPPREVQGRLRERILGASVLR